MAYTKTNLNETTETVAVDMTAEDIENNETTETVAEQSARAYSKTVWNESTPITVDRLNKIEDGIASALPLSGGALTGSILVPGESKFYNDAYVDPWIGEICSIKASGKVGIGGALRVNGNLKVNEYAHSPIFEASTDLVVNRYGFRTFYTNNQNGGYIFCDKNNSAIKLEDNKMAYTNNHGNLEIGPQNIHHCHIYTDRPSFYFNKGLLVNGNHVYHEGNFNPATKLDAGAFTVHNRDLRVHGKRALVGFNTADGDYLEINYGKDFAAGVRIKGLLGTESIASSGKLTFYNKIYGGGMSSLINCQELHNNTGNGQILTVGNDNRIYIGNPQTPLAIESSINPVVNIGQNAYQLYHTGNKPTAGDIGALPLSGGTLTGNIEVKGESRFHNGNYSDPWHGELCSIKASGHVGIGGSLRVNGKLAFSNIGTGGGLNANIHNLALHNHTGNGQMLTAETNRIFVGNPQTPLMLESNTGIVANISGTQQRVLTDRDSCSRFSWNGSRISIDGGGNNAAVNLADISELTRALHNWHTGQNLRLRAAGGLGALDGYITMTW